MTAPELKPCPFCKGTDTTIEGEGRVWSGVKGYSDPQYFELRHFGRLSKDDAFPRCHIVFRVRTEAEAIAVWNTRAPDPAHTGAVLELAASMVDCGCDPETKARVLSVPPNSAARWQDCGQANCGAMDAAAILALDPAAITTHEAAIRAAMVEGMRAAAKACDWGDIYGENAVRVIEHLIAAEERGEGKP